MPTYEFKCSCGEEKATFFDSIQEHIVLPVCTCGKKMKRQFSPPGIIFKGGGFYSTSKNK